MPRIPTITCILFSLAGLAFSQTFEVASIKATAASPGGERRHGPNIQTTPGNLTMRDVDLGVAIVWAYKISPLQVTNPPMGPGDRYDILAKAAGPATNDEMRIMLQALLAERFKMATHRETKEVSGYALIEAKGGHKLKEAVAMDGQGVMPIEDGKRMALGASRATLDQLAMFISMPLHAIVVDQTGLKGRYDFELDLTSFNIKGPRAKDEPEPDPVSILQQALPRQLGLRLEAKKMPVEMLVIDHLEKKPVEN